ncbi:hypothetical protein ACIGO8_20495 [Streptomyces sp. NPDC053493]|uniref:hypothetical protein n=1 Tax=Streptomyces sp. NPDC053493 TaxID=3365705 RepID=UPI0037CEB52E
MTTLYTTPSGYGRHRQPDPHFEESVQREAGPPAPVPVPVPGPAPTAVPGTALPGHTAPGHAAPGPAAHPADPPIYTAVLQLWASRGRTLPGHRDQEWSRLAAGPVWADRTVRVSGTLVRQGDGR